MSAVYGELLQSNPTLMTVLFAAASKQKLSSIQVVINLLWILLLGERYKFAKSII